MPRLHLPSIAAAALALVLGAGCAGTGGNGGGGPAALTGDDYLRAGDPDTAAALFAAELKTRPGDAVLEEKVRTARRLAAQRHAERAAIAAERGEWQVAAAELGTAQSFDADALPVRRLAETLAPKLAAAQKLGGEKGRARDLIESDPAAAEELLRTLRRGAPDDLELVSLLAAATRRAEADRAVARAEEAWNAGVRRRAVEHLAAATTGGIRTTRSDALRLRIETDLVADAGGAGLAGLRDLHALAAAAGATAPVLDLLRDRLASALRTEIDRHAAAAHPATAALFELECHKIGASVEGTNLDRVRRDRAIVLHVLPFEDATGGQVDGLRLARAVRDRIALDAAGGSTVLVTTDAPPPPGASFPHLVVRGKATAARITSGRVGRETRSVRYVSGTRSAENPAAAGLTAELTAARRSLADERERLTTAETRYRELEALQFSKTGVGLPGTEGDVAYQTKLATARAEVENARRTARAAESREFGIRQRILATPPTLAEPVHSEVPVEVTTLVKTAELAATLTLEDGGTVLLERQITGSDLHRETVAPPVPVAGLAEDRDESPDDAAMAARAAERFAELASGDVRAGSVRAALRLLEDARVAERRGDGGAAAEAYAAYLLSTPEEATAERAAAARALHEILGATPAVLTGFRPEVRR